MTTPPPPVSLQQRLAAQRAELQSATRATEQYYADGRDAGAWNGWWHVVPIAATDGRKLRSSASAGHDAAAVGAAAAAAAADRHTGRTVHRPEHSVVFLTEGPREPRAALPALTGVWWDGRTRFDVVATLTTSGRSAVGGSLRTPEGKLHCPLSLRAGYSGNAIEGQFLWELLPTPPSDAVRLCRMTNPRFLALVVLGSAATGRSSVDHSGDGAELTPSSGAEGAAAPAAPRPTVAAAAQLAEALVSGHAATFEFPHMAASSREDGLRLYGVSPAAEEVGVRVEEMLGSLSAPSATSDGNIAPPTPPRDFLTWAVEGRSCAGLRATSLHRALCSSDRYVLLPATLEDAARLQAWPAPCGFVHVCISSAHRGGGVTRRVSNGFACYELAAPSVDAAVAELASFFASAERL